MTGTRIAIATNNGDIGGGEVMLLQIARALRELGRAVTVIGPSAPGDLVERAAREGFDVHVLRAQGRRSYMLALALWRLRHPRIALWCNGLVPSLATAGIGPRIVHLHQLPGRAHRAVLRAARAGARRVVVPSRAVAAVVPRATVLPNWTAEIPVRVPARTEVPRAVRIGFLGRHTQDKGLTDLARAVEILQARGAEADAPSLRLVLGGENRFGDAEDDRAVDQALAPLGTAVARSGWVDPAAFLAGIDLLVVPSRTPESFGLVVAEAMASGVPVVVSDAGALSEVAGPEHPWIAPAGDPSTLASVLARAVEAVRDGSARAVADAARVRWAALYSPRAGAERVERLLDALTARDMPPVLDMPGAQAPGPDPESR